LMFCVLLLVFALAQAKISRGTLHRNVDKHLDGWWYMEKFGYALGEGTIKSSFTLEKDFMHDFTLGSEAQIAMYLDEDWPRALAAPTCREKLALSRHTISLAAHEMTSHIETRDTISYETTITQTIRPHIWYVAWVNCEDDALSSSHNPLFDVQFELVFRQPGGSHISVDGYGLQTLYLSVLVLFVAGLAVYMKQLMSVSGGSLVGGPFDSGGSSSWRRVPSFVWLFLVVALSEFVSVLLEALLWWDRASTGEERMFLEFSGELLNVVSHSLMATLFLSLSLGYLRMSSVANTKMQDSSGVSQSRQLCCVLLLVNACLLVGARLTDTDGHDSYHEFDTYVHSASLFLRLVCFAVCVGGYRSNAFAQSSARTGMRKMMYLASFWFLSPPVAVFVSPVFAEYWRHAFITFFLLLAQTASLAVIAAISLTGFAAIGKAGAMY